SLTAPLGPRPARGGAAGHGALAAAEESELGMASSSPGFVSTFSESELCTCVCFSFLKRLFQPFQASSLHPC
ncbi:Os07g0649400, partial [Oryza sativa Japonica Group]